MGSFAPADVGGEGGVGAGSRGARAPLPPARDDAARRAVQEHRCRPLATRCAAPARSVAMVGPGASNSAISPTIRVMARQRAINERSF
jgi:hypothetical protein